MPEILDSLPHDDPEARRSRRDLRMINALMGSYRWIARALAEHSPSSAVELGAGDGELGVRLANGGTPLAGLDFAPRPECWPEAWEWCQGDLFETLSARSEPAVVANLILHHFDDTGLRELGALLAGRDLLLFSEPARAWPHRLQAYALYALGINRVTRHDIHVSIRAGFRRGELPALLGLDLGQWSIHEHHTALGALRLVARRKI